MTWLPRLGEILSFLGVQYLLGRRGSFPYGLLMKFDLFEISVMVVLSDILQTILLLCFFSWISPRLNKVKGFITGLFRRKKKKVRRRPGKCYLWLKKMDGWGLFFVAAVPYGGGALSGSVMAVSLKMEKQKAFFIIIAGCIVSTFLYYLGFSGILTLLEK